MQIASLQTISGTGANFLAASLTHSWLRTNSSSTLKVYIGTPAWGNYVPFFTHAGFEVVEYSYYNKVARQVDFNTVVRTLREAPQGRLFVLQRCCQNPTGMDFSDGQWNSIATIMKSKKYLPLIGTFSMLLHETKRMIL